jgi:hypothetical protein
MTSFGRMALLDLAGEKKIEEPGKSPRRVRAFRAKG